MTYKVTFTNCAPMIIHHCYSRANAIDKAVLQKNCPAYGESKTQKRKAVVSAKQVL